MRCIAGGIVLGCAAWLGACAADGPPADPMTVLHDDEATLRSRRAAIEAIDVAALPGDQRRRLHDLLWKEGVTDDVRLATLEKLAAVELDQVVRTTRRHLPRQANWSWLSIWCRWIADHELVELTPALVSSWARPAGIVRDDRQRPEHLALVRLHGADRVDDVVMDTLLASRSVAQQGLRTRCWSLLHRLGLRDRLVALLREGTIHPDDAFLRDLRAGVLELGLVPHNREEILWLRTLRMPEHAAFWAAAVEALAEVDSARRGTMALRDLPVAVSAKSHRPVLLALSDRELLRVVTGVVRGRRHYAQGSNIEGFAGRGSEDLATHLDRLTWGDAAAMVIALEALAVPEVVVHLFDYADRDHLDETTEYGGIIRLDAQGRFEVVEFPPRVRHHDRRFNAPQAMFDASYTAIFHFHFHAQAHVNRKYAGPGFGDSNYADNTRANCLVLTFIDRDTLNVDYYRHDRVVVDLGTITRPATP